MKRLVLSIMIVVLCLLAFFGSAFSKDKPSIELDWYGYFKLDGSYDQNLTSHGNFVMWVNPQIDNRDDDQFNMTANQTRLGFNAIGKGYDDVKVNGKVEFDLYGSVSGATVAQNKPMIMIRHAYFSVASGNFKLLAGQTWDLISPLNAPTLNYPVLWGCGNIGYRRPQVSFWYDAPAGDNTNVILAAGFFRTIGNDLTPTFNLAVGEAGEGADDGTDAAVPSFQGRIEVKHKFNSGHSLRTGLSGLWGQLKAETNQGNYENYESQGVNGYLHLSMASGVGFVAEAYSGSNLGGYFGSILNSNTIEGVASNGGYGALWFKVSPKVKLSGGGGLDKVEEADIGNGKRSQNSCFFGNVKYSVVHNVTVGFEVASWETKYKNDDAARNLRLQTSFIMDF